MDRKDPRYEKYISILREELQPAMGCTEPISLAYASAKARAVLGSIPQSVTAEVSGNIIKNVKSVVVPHTGGGRGIQTAVAAGIVAGNEEAELEVLSGISEEQVKDIEDYRNTAGIEVAYLDEGHIFDIRITARKGQESAVVRITGNHTNIVLIKKDDTVIFEKEIAESSDDGMTDRSDLTIEGIVDFAETVDPYDVREILERQISFNMAIAEEGLANDYGANIGSSLLEGHEDDINYRIRAYAAAASDARMNGCEMPVVINSGSGNQGITSSVPVIVYADHVNSSHDELLRALCVSNLVTIHLKTGIGRLSAYCVAVSAGCGAGAGIAWLQGGRFDKIAHTVVNSVAMISGTICDGAKASCAAKIASAVDAGLLGLKMYNSGNQFFGGDGIVKKGVENTIDNVGKLARLGMQQTDREIIRLMMDD